jgi:hypothetical protein
MTDATLATQVATATIALVIGIAIGSLVSGAARSALRLGRPRPPERYRSVTAASPGGEDGKPGGGVKPTGWGDRRISAVLGSQACTRLPVAATSLPSMTPGERIRFATARGSSSRWGDEARPGCAYRSVWVGLPVGLGRR